ncbi:hypothetical protein [Amycolatopsis taiwanensis]|uniref:Uncharacterized protein n=1 Tax=Amycolatopsis taiwanensis TaxID=342230 RepID=A0A9W6R0X6_9PSEU|nr:hypothetical protein [Amycolatopsis taiwanensis]GLY67556.1 hypothetical protein Atai01_41750 [Amycolatopsis taiwanensis]
MGELSHACAPAKADTAFPALLRRFPDLALADPHEQVDFRVFSVVYGLHALQVTW